MRHPIYEHLMPQLAAERPSVCGASGPPRPYGNPRHVKFYWRIFSLESRHEGDDFLRRAPVLCRADYLRERHRLLAKGMSLMVYGFLRRRLDPANPWDPSKARWKNVTFAPSWDEDKDPVIDGGHK